MLKRRELHEIANLGGFQGGGWGRGGLHGVVAKPDVCFRPTSLREWPENGGGLRGRLSIYRGFRPIWGFYTYFGVQMTRLYTLPLTAQTRQK